MVVNPACLSWGGLGAVNTGSDVWISFIITSPSYKNPVLYLLLKAEVSDPVVLANAAFQAGFWNRKLQLQVTTYDFVAFQATHSCFSDLFYLWNCTITATHNFQPVKSYQIELVRLHMLEKHELRAALNAP